MKTGTAILLVGGLAVVGFVVWKVAGRPVMVGGAAVTASHAPPASPTIQNTGQAPASRPWYDQVPWDKVASVGANALDKWLDS